MTLGGLHVPTFVAALVAIIVLFFILHAVSHR